MVKRVELDPACRWRLCLSRQVFLLQIRAELLQLDSARSWYLQNHDWINNTAHITWTTIQSQHSRSLHPALTSTRSFPSLLNARAKPFLTQCYCLSIVILRHLLPCFVSKIELMLQNKIGHGTSSEAGFEISNWILKIIVYMHNTSNNNQHV